MITRDLSFAAGEELLAAKRVTPDGPVSARMLFLHGAGKAVKERALPLAERLAVNHSIESFLFDFSGHGASSGSLEASSLRKRVEEALTAFHHSTFSPPVSVCAFSMGGHIALELIPRLLLRAVILFYPAVYATEAEEIPFGNPLFTEILRRENSWETSQSFKHLHSFEGNLLVVAGESDTVIPRGVIDKLIKTASSARQKRLIVVGNAPHLLLPVLFEREDLLDEVCALIATYSIEP